MFFCLSLDHFAFVLFELFVLHLVSLMPCQELAGKNIFEMTRVVWSGM